MKYREINRESKSVETFLTKGKELFWKFGIKKVSVDEICSEAGMSKMTFYRNFENKYHLAHVILKDFAETSHNTFTKLFSQSIPFPEIIVEFMQVKKEQARNTSMEFIKDIYAKNEFTDHLLEVLQEGQENIMKVVFERFEKAKKEGWIRPEFDVAVILYLFEKVGRIAEDDHFTSMFSSSEQMVDVLNSFLFNGIIAKNQDK